MDNNETLKELQKIEKERYRLYMRIECVEAEIKRVSPFSEQFDLLVAESLNIQEQQRDLMRKRMELIAQQRQ